MSGRRPLEGFGVFKVFRISGFRGELSEAGGMRVEGRELVGLFAVASDCQELVFLLRDLSEVRKTGKPASSDSGRLSHVCSQPSHSP